MEKKGDSNHVHPFMTTEVSVLQRPPQSPDPSPVKQLWDVVEQESLCDAVMEAWTNISEGQK